MGGASGARLVGEEGEREPSHCGCSPRPAAMKAHTSKPRHRSFLSTLVLPGGSAASEVLAKGVVSPVYAHIRSASAAETAKKRSPRDRRRLLNRQG